MTFSIKKSIPRRSVLRGLVQGTAIGISLPFLECFLNDSGTALASGAPLPVRFGSWFWGLGHSAGFGISQDSAGIELLEEAKALEPFKSEMNYFSKFNVPLDGRANAAHYSGMIACRTGTAPANDSEIPAPTLDVLVADAVGAGTRFRSLEFACTGNPRDCYTARNSGSRNSADVSPLALYNRIFGVGFADPNKAEFVPDPRVIVRQSVLTAVNEQGKAFARTLGAADRTYLDEYFTSIRQIEQQLTLQLEKPPPAAACVMPPKPPETPVGTEIETAIANHRLMTQIVTLALACNQTRVFSIVFSDAASSLRKPGQAYTHHMLSHEEPADSALHYQREVHWFNCRSMESLAVLVDALAKVKEGSGTLLDNTLLFAHSDTNNARVHALDGIPIMTFGRAGGRLKTGVHVAGNGDPITGVGLTAMQAMGLTVDRWGTASLATSKAISTVLA